MKLTNHSVRLITTPPWLKLGVKYRTFNMPEKQNLNIHIKKTTWFILGPILWAMLGAGVGNYWGNALTAEARREESYKQKQLTAHYNLLRCLAYLAQVDGQATQQEIAGILVIFKNMHDEDQQIASVKDVLANCLANKVPLKTSCSKFNASATEIFRELLLSSSLAIIQTDGKIVPEEKQAVQELYRCLGRTP